MAPVPEQNKAQTSVSDIKEQFFISKAYLNLKLNMLTLNLKYTYIIYKYE